jgi:O-antigen/teichoic acid export membrane protein
MLYKPVGSKQGPSRRRKPLRLDYDAVRLTGCYLIGSLLGATFAVGFRHTGYSLPGAVLALFLFGIFFTCLFLWITRPNRKTHRAEHLASKAKTENHR